MNDNFDLEIIKELQQLAQLKDEDIDTSDIPEHTDWTAAKRGYFYRPQSEHYQLQINSVLREYSIITAIIVNQKPRSSGAFLCNELNTQQRFRTAYHPGHHALH